MKELNARLRAAGLLAAAGALLLIGLPSFAADAPKDDTKKDEPKEAVEQIIVTGSRIHHDSFTSDSPIQVITKDESVLAGLVTTTETLQGSTVTGGSQQINNYFGGYVTDGGPGANTLSLRGLGATRTLVLLNGRRLAPAGTRGSVGSADLNVLPNAMVDRIEILKDGASSIYGSDAVAGVVNIITRKGIKDFTVEATQMNTWDKGGNQTTISGTWGHTWDRLELSGSLEMYARSNLGAGQRDWSKCPTYALVDPTTGQYDGSAVLDPVTGKPKCFPVNNGGVNSEPNGYVGGFLFDPNTGDYLGSRWGLDPSSNSPPGLTNVNPFSKRSGFSPSLLNDSIISPTRNYTAFVNGSYDLQALGNAEAYFELLWNHRASAQVGSQQVLLDYQYDSQFNAHPFVPQVFYDYSSYLVNPAGTDYLRTPFGDVVEARGFVAVGNDVTRESVQFTRLVSGIRGDLSFTKNWKYDANVTLSRANGGYTFEAFLADRVWNSMYVAPAPGGYTGPTRTANGTAYTCASNLSGATSNCVPVPLLDANLLGGNVDPAWLNYARRPITGHTLYTESTFAANADGSLFPMPAGDARAAFGVEIRSMKEDDTPSAEMQSGNLYNLSTAGITKGKDAVREAFGEIELPLLRGLPMAESLSLDLSGRITQYNSYGSDHTYKGGFSYSPVSWLKIRGTKGSSYRAPAIFEQYLSPTTGYYPGTYDPCSDYGQLPANSPIRINCAAEGLPITFQNNGSITVSSAGGAAVGLKSEQSYADTLGVVFQPALSAAAGDLAIAGDWWRISVGNEVAQIGALNILTLCYRDPAFRSGGKYCAFNTRDTNGDLNVVDNYVNIATQVAEGVDYNVRYARDVGIGRLTVDLRATRYLRQDSKLLPTDPLGKYNGTVESPKWVGDIEFIYKWKDWTARYGLTYIDAMNSNGLYDPPINPATDLYNYSVGHYTTSDVSLKYNSPAKWSVLVGIRNLNDEKPKRISPEGNFNYAANSLLYSGYDFYGRRVFLSLSKSM